MPTYVYRFDDVSDETTEVRQMMSEDALEEIDGRPVHRVPQGGRKTQVFLGRFTTNEKIQQALLSGDPTGL